MVKSATTFPFFVHDSSPHYETCLRKGGGGAISSSKMLLSGLSSLTCLPIDTGGASVSTKSELSEAPNEVSGPPPILSTSVPDSIKRLSPPDPTEVFGSHTNSGLGSIGIELVGLGKVGLASPVNEGVTCRFNISGVEEGPGSGEPKFSKISLIS